MLSQMSCRVDDVTIRYLSAADSKPLQSSKTETRHVGQYGTEHWGTFLLRMPTSFFQRPPFLPSASVAREMVRATATSAEIHCGGNVPTTLSPNPR